MNWVVTYREGNCELTNSWKADRAVIEGGALLLTLGDIYNRQIVVGFGPGYWLSFGPASEEDSE